MLKAVVIGLGVLIILGFAALIYGLAVKGGKLVKPGYEPLLLPAGAGIADMAMSERQLALRVTMGEHEEILLIDLRSGRVMGRIPVQSGESVP